MNLLTDDPAAATDRLARKQAVACSTTTRLITTSTPVRYEDAIAGVFVDYYSYYCCVLLRAKTTNSVLTSYQVLCKQLLPPPAASTTQHISSAFFRMLRVEAGLVLPPVLRGAAAAVWCVAGRACAVEIVRYFFSRLMYPLRTARTHDAYRALAFCSWLCSSSCAGLFCCVCLRAH